MIDEIASIAHTTAIIGSPDYYASLIRHKKRVAQTTLKELKNSAKEAVLNSKSRRVGKTALAGINLAYLYGDDIAFYNLYSQLKEDSPFNGVLKEGVPMLITGAAIVAAAIHLSTKNQEQFPVMRARETLGEDLSDQQTFRERIRNRFEQARKHMGKLALSLTIGVPLSATQENYSDNEIVAHSGVYAAVSVGLYEAANISLGVIDHPVAPVILAGGVMGIRFINTACERVADRYAFTDALVA